MYSYPQIPEPIPILLYLAYVLGFSTMLNTSYPLSLILSKVVMSTLNSFLFFFRSMSQKLMMLEFELTSMWDTEGIILVI